MRRRVKERCGLLCVVNEEDVCIDARMKNSAWKELQDMLAKDGSWMPHRAPFQQLTWARSPSAPLLAHPRIRHITITPHT